MTLKPTQTQAYEAARAAWRYRRKDSPEAIIVTWLGISQRDAEYIIADLEDAGYDLEGMPPKALVDLASETFRILDLEGLLTHE